MPQVDIFKVLIRVRCDDSFPETVGDSINHKRLVVGDIESNKNRDISGYNIDGNINEGNTGGVWSGSATVPRELYVMSAKW